jgi:hypothetical protein
MLSSQAHNSVALLRRRVVRKIIELGLLLRGQAKRIRFPWLAENTRKPEDARAAQERSRPTNCPASAWSPGPEAPSEAALFRVGDFQSRIVHVIRIEHNDTSDLGRIAAAINPNVRSRVTCPN